MAILSDAEFLGLAVASESLAGVDPTVRDMHRQAASAKVLAPVMKKYGMGATNGALYVLPLATPPALLTGDAIGAAAWFLKGLAADIAGFTIIGHRGVSASDPTYPVVKDRHDIAIAFLSRLALGEEAEIPGLDPERGAPLVAHGAPLRWGAAAHADPYGCAPFTRYTGIDLGDGES